MKGLVVYLVIEHYSTGPWRYNIYIVLFILIFPVIVYILIELYPIGLHHGAFDLFSSLNQIRTF